MQKLFIVAITVVVAYACVPIKDIKYLQPTSDLEVDSLGYIIEKESEYHLQIDDILVMNITSRDPTVGDFFGKENTNLINSASEGIFYISGLSVDESGYIEIPSLGRFYVLNKTLDQVTTDVERKMHTIYQPDAVFVKMKLTGINYTIVGEVNGPGQYTVYRNRLNIIDAIARAGDLSLVADRKNVRLLRKYPEGRKIVEIDLTKDTLMNSEYFYVQANDIILVNPKIQKTIGAGTNIVGTISAVAGTLGSILAIYSIVDRFTN